MIILIDNYGGFTYNLAQVIGGAGYKVNVLHNDELEVEQILDLRPEKIILTPGPGQTVDAGVCERLVRHCPVDVPLLGIGLGHQCVCAEFGGEVGPAKTLMHGKTALVRLDNHPLFAGLRRAIKVGCYHSLVVSASSLPTSLRVIAVDEKGCVMAVAHSKRPLFGLQFHPESILTESGEDILRNFCELTPTTEAPSPQTVQQGREIS